MDAPKVQNSALPRLHSCEQGEQDKKNEIGKRLRDNKENKTNKTKREKESPPTLRGSSQFMKLVSRIL